MAVVLPVRCGLHLSVLCRRGSRLEVLGDYMSVDGSGCTAGFGCVVFVAWANSKPGAVGLELSCATVSMPQSDRSELFE